MSFVLEHIKLDRTGNMEEWDAFVERHPHGTPLHLSGWLSCIRDAYGYTPDLYVLKNQTNEIKGVFPYFHIRSLLGGSRVISLPFSDYGGPLLSEGCSESFVVKPLLEQYAKNVKYIEIRSLLSHGRNFVSHNFYKRHILNLSSHPETLRKRFHKNVIGSIKRAKKVGVEITQDNTEEGLNEFYRLNSYTRRKHGVPLQPRQFFQALYQNIIKRGYGYISLARIKQDAVAASIFLKMGSTILYKYNASDPQFLAKATPNHLLIWKTIQQACKEGYQYFDFGRTASSNAGLMRYKRSWGAEVFDLHYCYYPAVKLRGANEGESIAYKVITGIWKLLPSTVSDRLGPRVMKYLA